MGQSQIVNVVKKSLPAVITVTASKRSDNVKKSLNPFGSPGFPFEDFLESQKGQKIKLNNGSGFIISPSGIVLTNRHVVADPSAEYTAILHNKKKFKIKVLAQNPINDIAILKIGSKNLPTLKLGDSSKLELGQTVIAIGTALGIFESTVSVGVVSGLSRDIKARTASGEQETKLRGLIQTDAAINPGNSGGPLLDIKGKVIGINAAMVFLAENISFALPINTAKKDFEELKRYKRVRQPFLGIRYIPLSKNLQKKYNFPVDRGALVISEPLQGDAVIKGSSAGKAGIQELDIILEVNNKKISETNSLTDLLYEYKVGDKVRFKILRKNQKISLDLEVEEKK